MALNRQSYCLSPPSAGIAAVKHQIWLVFWNLFMVGVRAVGKWQEWGMGDW
jgi:hypothetical protein